MGWGGRACLPGNLLLGSGPESAGLTRLGAGGPGAGLRAEQLVGAWGREKFREVLPGSKDPAGTGRGCMVWLGQLSLKG